MLDKLKKNRLTVGLVAVIILAIFIGGGVFVKIQADKQAALPIEEVDLAFDVEGPYALLLPRRDGNAVVLELKRTASYDSITYELAYVSLPDEIKNLGKVPSGDGEGASEGATSPTEGIDRGVMGTINTENKKGEYQQDILFGTCSKNVCKYDKGVENGTLTLHIRKGRNAYRMETQWHLQRPDVALGVITSGDNHFIYTTKDDRTALANVGYTIVNELTGVPKLPNGKQVLGKVYALNTPIAKSFPAGTVMIETAGDVPSDAKIARYNEAQNNWEMLDTKNEGGTLSASAPGGGIFAILDDN